MCTCVCVKLKPGRLLLTNTIMQGYNEEKAFMIALKRIPGDVKVVCADGETTLIRNIVCARSEWFATMLSCKFAEGLTNIINFPEKELSVMQIVLNYLQWSEYPPALGVEDTIKVYNAAKEFLIEPFRLSWLKHLNVLAEDEQTALEVYEKCRDEDFSGVWNYVRDRIELKVTGRAHVVKCDKCNERVMGYVCGYSGCQYVMQADETKCTKCKNKAKNAIKKAYHVYNLRCLTYYPPFDTPLVLAGKNECGGKLSIHVDRRLITDNVSDGTLVEIMKTMCITE